MRRKNRQRASASQPRQLIAQLNPRSPITEQYRTLRTNLQFSAVDEPLDSILVTSTNPSEGKSLTVANLAIVYAQTGKKVLLIDSDMRKPTVHYTFRLNNIQGMSNVLIGDSVLEEAVSSTSVDNLDVMTSGPIPPNPAELLASKRMETLLAEAKGTYDVVIIDTPPMLAVTDAQILSQIVDGSLLVVRSKQTEYEGAAKAVEMLKQGSGRVLGTVLNDCEKTADNSYYYYGTD